MEENRAAKKAMNKTEILTALGETTGLSKQQVGSLFDELAKLIGKNLGADGPGVFVIPGLLQIKVVRKPATEERKGINPFTKEEMVIKAKPAKNVVKVVALKGLKELVSEQRSADSDEQALAGRDSGRPDVDTGEVPRE